MRVGSAPSQSGGRNFATWLRDGSIAGTGWRGAPHTAEPTRGYDDVSVKLVHE